MADVVEIGIEGLSAEPDRLASRIRSAVKARRDDPDFVRRARVALAVLNGAALPEASTRPPATAGTHVQICAALKEAGRRAPREPFEVAGLSLVNLDITLCAAAALDRVVDERAHELAAAMPFLQAERRKLVEIVVMIMGEEKTDKDWIRLLFPALARHGLTASATNFHAFYVQVKKHV